MKFDIDSFTDPGPRKSNEDAVLACGLADGSYLIAVADGLGGHFGGAQASSLAIDILSASKLSTAAEFRDAFLHIHKTILQKQKLDSTVQGMATTMTAVRLDGNRLIGAHCGDTRCVLQRGEGIKKLTTEHTEAQRLFEAGKLTKEQLLTYPRRNILDSALGVSEALRIDTIEYDLWLGDKVLITSDGVHEVIRLRMILELLRKSSSVSGALEDISESVLRMGAEDNFSASCAFST